MPDAGRLRDGTGQDHRRLSPALPICNEAALLGSCYRACLALAWEHGCRSVDFPSISTGVYGYPLPQAAHIALRELVAFDRTHEGMTLRMVCHTPEALHAYQVDWNMFYQETKPHED